MAKSRWKPRADWMPLCAAELCACIAVLAMQGRLSPADEQYVAEYIDFRHKLRRQHHDSKGD